MRMAEVSLIDVSIVYRLAARERVRRGGYLSADRVPVLRLHALRLPQERAFLMVLQRAGSGPEEAAMESRIIISGCPLSDTRRAVAERQVRRGTGIRDHSAERRRVHWVVQAPLAM
jgi:hypothetical protein